MSEQGIKILVVVAIVAAFVLTRLYSRAASRRRLVGIERLVSPFAAEVLATGEGGERRAFRSDDRDFELSDAYRGGGLGVETRATRYVALSTALRGRGWDLHSLTIRRRRRKGSFEERLSIQEFGFPMRDGWLTERVKSAMLDLYDLPAPNGELVIEAGSLVYRTMSSITDFEPEAFAGLVKQHGALAAALEEGYR